MGNCENFKAVIWDLDGTILDTRRQHWDAMRRIARQQGLSFDPESLKEHYGKTSFEILSLVLGNDFTREELADLVAKKEIIFRELISEGVEFLPGVEACLRKFQSMGLIQTIASSTAMDNILAVIDTLKAREFFSEIISGESFPSKPNPKIFREAVSRLGLPPSQCLVIEDSPHGVEAAKAANVKCIAVSLSYSIESLSSADIVLKSLEAVDFAAVCHLFTEE